MRKKSQIEWQIMVWPAIVFLLVFNILPLLGLTAAFQDFKLSLGFFRSPWASTDGRLDIFKHFKAFFADKAVWGIIRNTLVINLLNLAIGFPVPILFALLLNELTHKHLRKAIQTITYFPYFVSWIVFGSIFIKLLNPATGIFSLLAEVFHRPATDYLNEPKYFYAIAVFTSLLKGLGWNSIIYTAALTGTDPCLVEYATLEGASRWQKWRHVYLPAIAPTILLYFVFAVGALFSSNFDQIYILKNNLNQDRAEVISTYVYAMGIGSGQFELSYSTAVGIMQSIISIVLVLATNQTAKKLTGRGIV